MESIISSRIPYSELRIMFDAAQALEQQGRSLVHMELGRPDFNTPEHIVEAAVSALRNGKHHYCANAGIPELRNAIAAKYAREYHLEYSPAKEILVTNGVAEGIFLAISALLNPGDQILVPDPVWLNYNVVPVMNFVEPIGYTLSKENNFQPDPDEIESLITPRTRMIVLVSPSNPTGGLISPENSQRIAALAEKYNLIVLSDEIYEKVVYSPATFTSFATLPGMKERTVVVNGFSKYYSMTGWRLGYVLGPSHLINPMLRYHQYALTSVATFAQYGAVAALEGTQEPSIAMVKEFHARRDYFYKELTGMKGFSCDLPDGAFYLFPNISKTGMSGKEMAAFLLEKAGVVAVPGDAFGKGGRGHVRFSYACSLDALKTAVKGMHDALASL